MAEASADAKPEVPVVLQWEARVSERSRWVQQKRKVGGEIPEKKMQMKQINLTLCFGDFGLPEAREGLLYQNSKNRKP